MLIKSDRYRGIGEQIRAELFPELQGIRIAWLVSDKAKKKAHNVYVNADCRKASKQYEWCCDYDFIITVYEPNVMDFTDKQIEILLEHELMHIDAEHMTTRPHDAEEFKDIIRKYGIDWNYVVEDNNDKE